MSQRVCPWWIGYLLASPLRRWIQDPVKIIAPYVREGMTVLEPGPGMGFFTLDMARMVGPNGRVIAIDIQPRMLSSLKGRLLRAGLLARVDVRLVGPESLGVEDLAGKVDFTLAFALVHEMPSAQVFFREVAAASRKGAALLLVEPAGHVKADTWDSELEAAKSAGFILTDRPSVKRSLAAAFVKA